MLYGLFGFLDNIGDFFAAGVRWVRATMQRVLKRLLALFEVPSLDEELALALAGHARTAGTADTPTRESQPAVPAPKTAPAPANDASTNRDSSAQPAARAVADAAANNQEDETALARMLASDDGPREVRFIKGWFAVQRQRARKVSMFEFLTRNLGYGPRERKAQGVPNVYASTAAMPTATDRAVAHGLLSGTVFPSNLIRMHKPGQIFERGPTLSDATLLRRQNDLKEGIYARLQGTDWFLFSPDAPAIAPKKGETAKDALERVPMVAVMEPVS